MFDFYNIFYEFGYLSLDDIKEATKWKLLTSDEFKQITGQDYVEQ
ncbi:XkdX family protein [Clostridium tyrobutyricum]|nr:XkdX family protein [Clostridium tyrobutyricum]QCH28094.1 hypothetical protein EZN00_01695 [Clostridium tyrobutyricum]